MLLARREWILLVVAAALAGGCSRPPQVGRDQRRLIESLRTAISAKRTDWLEANAKLVEERHTKGELSDEEFAAFDAIVSEARAGNWAAAEKQVIALAKSQQPTAEDLERLKARKPEH